MADTGRLILHIGAVKCGSSALQAFLSSTNVVDADGTPAVYAAITPKNGVRAQQDLRRAAKRSVHGYMASVAPVELNAMDPAYMEVVVKRLRTLLSRGRTVILSNEGWFQQSQHVFDSGFLEQLGFPFEAYVAIRPQVDYMNSSWWQWGAWSEFDLDQWVSRKIRSCHWHQAITSWQNHDLCKSLHIAPLGGDIATDFMHRLGLRLRNPETAAAAKTVNVSLPGEILRLMQRHRDLRPSVSASQIDFALARHGLGTKSTPWVMDKALCEKVIGACRLDNQRLCDMLPTADRRRVEGNPKWWHADAYASKTVEPSTTQPPDPDDIDALCAAMAKTIFDLERRLRRAQG